MSLEFEEETYLLRKCFFEVQNDVGRGRREEGYHQACLIWFKEHQLPVASKPPHRLMLRGEVAHSLFPDFVAWNAITVEMKAVTHHLGQSEFVQLFDYLKCRQDRIGLLVNMGLDRVAIERVVYDPPETEWNENWDSWTHHIDGKDREVGLAVRDSIRVFYGEHTTSYGEEALTKLILCSLGQHGLSVTANPVAKAFFHGVEVDESSLACFLVENRIVLVVSALFDTNDFNVNRVRTYLQALDLHWGVAADFGKKKAEVVGIRRG